MRSLPADVLLDLERLFQRLGVGWYLFGAQAAAIHGASRLTIDVDVTVSLGETPTQALVEALHAESFTLRIDDDEFVQRTRVLPVVHSSSGVPVDIVLAGPGIEELFLQRAKMHTIRGIRIPVACPEDIVVMKVLAGRAKDVDDVLAILRARASDIDLGLVRETIRLLEQALDRRDLLPVLERAVGEAAVSGTTVTQEPRKKATGKRASPTRPRSRTKKDT